MRYKAAVFHGPGSIKVETREAAIGPREGLIRIGACGVCGTDLHIYHYPFWHSVHLSKPHQQ